MVNLKKRRKETADELRQLEPLKTPPRDFKGGVLLSDKIIHLCKEVPPENSMIRPFDEKNLHPAGYKLTIGNEFAINGEVLRVSDDGKPDSRTSITIEPFQVAILQTRETLCIPRFLIARWNIVVKSAYRGLLWVGAAQVDPGWPRATSMPNL